MSVSDFYKIELEKLNLEFDKIQLFSKHPPTLGIYREQVLKSYIRQFIPSSLSISSGFVFNNEKALNNEIYASQTKQIDCMVFDENNFVPYLKTQDFVIIEPNALYAGIEVKSTLTLCKSYCKNANFDEYPFFDSDGKRYKWTGTLIDALINIKSIWDNTNYSNKQVVKAIFAYSMTFDPNLLYMALDNDEIQKQIGIQHLNELPLYICVPNDYLICFSRTALDWDESLGFDPYESEMTVIKMTNKDKAFGLQLFSVGLKNNIEYRLKKNTTRNKRPIFLLWRYGWFMVTSF